LAAFVVEAATWAPSVHNTQPWGFTFGGAGLTVFADAGRQLPVADASGREMLISCGAALFNARLAVRSLGYVPKTQVLPDPAEPLLIARLSCAGHQPAADFEQQLFRQVTRRRTHRGGFDPLPLSGQLLALLTAGAARTAPHFASSLTQPTARCSRPRFSLPRRDSMPTPGTCRN
jgi:hypothetical protein